MKKPALITCLLLFLSILATAQDNKTNVSKSDSIIKIIPVYGSRHSAYLYTVGGQPQTREDVNIRLMRYAPSAAELSKARTDATWTYITFAGSAISGIFATIEYAHNNKNAGVTTGMVNGQPGFIYPHHNLIGAYILTGAATGFLTAAVIKLVHAQKHGEKALKLYNQQFE